MTGEEAAAPQLSLNGILSALDRIARERSALYEGPPTYAVRDRPRVVESWEAEAVIWRKIPDAPDLDHGAAATQLLIMASTVASHVADDHADYWRRESGTPDP